MRGEIKKIIDENAPKSDFNEALQTLRWKKKRKKFVNFPRKYFDCVVVGVFLKITISFYSSLKTIHNSIIWFCRFTILIEIQFD